MKNNSKFKRIIAGFLCAVLSLGALPMSAFAFTAEPGKTCEAFYGHKYTGSDGNTYHSPESYQAIHYDTAGNQTVRSHNGGGARATLWLRDDSGERQVMCIESGVDYGAYENYESVNGKNSAYFQNLPATAQYGIMLTSIYGWAPDRAVPVSGCNEDDFSIATQTIYWEYQQLLRVSPASRTTNSFGIDKDTYYNGIKGRPAEKCYNWILEQMQRHATVPSFASNQKQSAQTYTLKYDPVKKNYSLTLTDSNNTLADINFTDSRISVSRSGNKYTFTSNTMIENAVGIKAQKKIAQPMGKFLVWGNVGKQTMCSGAEDPVYFYFNIKTETTGIGHIIKHSEDGVVGGISFTISGNGVNKTVTTKDDGTVDIELMPGVYTVTEQTIDKYVPQNVQRVTIVSGGTSNVTFSNVLKRGDLKVIKSSEDNFVKGVKFHLFGTSLSGIPVDEYAVTDKSGVATFSDVLISGSTPYTLEEVDTAIRYVVPPTQTAPVKWKEVTNRSVDNILKKFAVTVTKSDYEEGTAQGDATLAGAVYGIYKGDTLIDEYVTDENGQFTTKEYICDTDWTIREIKPSEGYLLDDTVHAVGADPKLYTVEHNLTSNDVTEEVIKGNIALIKHTDDGDTQIETPEEGATFEIYLKSAGSFEAADADERDTIVCDENGFGQTKDMPYGVYTVYQTSGWEGRELMKDFDVFIAQDEATYRYLMNNANFESYIKVVKVDAESGKNIPYAGAGFEIYDPAGNKISMTFTYPTPTTIDVFYTNADGELVTPEMLPYGEGYSLVEVQAPYGYVIDRTPVYFDVAQDNSTEESGVTVIKVNKENMAQKGVIIVEKTGEVFWGVNVSGDEDSETLYQPVYQVSGLAGAVFEIRAISDVITPDGTLRYAAGELVDTITTGEDGIAKSRELYLGKYSVVEVQAPNGMLLNSETHEVELTYAGQEVAVTETATYFYNERQKVSVNLSKVMELNEKYGIGANGEVVNVSFGLYAAEELVSASGTTIPADGLIEILMVDENGKAVVSSDLPLGKYYVKEIATDSHYLLNDAKYPFEFAYAGQTVELVEITANDGKDIENDLIYGSVSGKKVDENGEALGGALIGIFKADETEFTKDNAIETTVSADDGSFSFENVPYGVWVVKEIEAPTGYVLDGTPYQVTVNEDEQVIEITVTDEFVRGNISLTKVDKDFPDNKLSGAVFEVYKDLNGDGKLDDGDELLGELEEADKGIYEMKELLYGKYLVKETKAPEGFVLDEGVYSVFIEENGKTYQVENEAGVGFINDAMRGSLKIVKTSSDGKVEGFSFRVTGENGYDKTFVTDAKGEILIENLRIGEYTISEVSDKASANYVLPANKDATVKVGSTTVVTMHNELRDTPKTGDNSHLGLWFTLAGLSALGIAATTFVALKKKKKEDAE